MSSEKLELSESPSLSLNSGYFISNLVIRPDFLVMLVPERMLLIVFSESILYRHSLSYYSKANLRCCAY